MTTTSTRVPDGTHLSPGTGPPRSGRPLPTRQRRPVLGVVAVLLIVVGALGGGYLYVHGAAKTQVLVVQRPVPAGHKVTTADLGESGVAGLPDALPATKRNQVVGKRAATNLVRGQVLVADLLTSTETPKPGDALVGVTVQPGQMPAEGLQPGDVVNAVVAAAGDAGQVPQPVTGSDEPTVLATRAAVFATGRATASGATTVTLLVAERDAARLSSYGASGQVALIRVNAKARENP